MPMEGAHVLARLLHSVARAYILMNNLVLLCFALKRVLVKIRKKDENKDFLLRRFLWTLSCSAAISSNMTPAGCQSARVLSPTFLGLASSKSLTTCICATFNFPKQIGPWEIDPAPPKVLHTYLHRNQYHQESSRPFDRK